MKLLYLISAALLFSISSFSQPIVSAGKQFNFQHYGTEEGLSHPNIFKISQSSKGHLLVSTLNGLSIFDGVNFKIYTKKLGLTGRTATCAIEDNDHNIWVASKGVALLRNEKFITFDSLSGMPREMVWYLYKDRDGTMWAGSPKGVYHLNPAKLDKPLIRFYPLRHITRYITRRKDGALIAGGEGDVLIIGIKV